MIIKNKSVKVIGVAGNMVMPDGEVSIPDVLMNGALERLQTMGIIEISEEKSEEASVKGKKKAKKEVEEVKTEVVEEPEADFMPEPEASVEGEAEAPVKRIRKKKGEA